MPILICQLLKQLIMLENHYKICLDFNLVIVISCETWHTCFRKESSHHVCGIFGKNLRKSIDSFCLKNLARSCEALIGLLLKKILTKTDSLITIGLKIKCRLKFSWSKFNLKKNSSILRLKSKQISDQTFYYILSSIQITYQIFAIKSEHSRTKTSLIKLLCHQINCCTLILAEWSLIRLFQTQVNSDKKTVSSENKLMRKKWKCILKPDFAL